MDASNNILFNVSALHSLKRPQLIVLCKRYKVKASGKNDDIVARLQAHGQSLVEDSKSSRSISTQDSSGSSTSKHDEAPRTENGAAGLATADTPADTTPDTTIRAPELILRATSKDGTNSRLPNQQLEVVEGGEDEAEFGELKITDSVGSISSKSTASRALTIVSASGTSTRSSISKGSVISSRIMSIAKSIKNVASKASFKSSSLGSGSQPAAPAHYVLARTTAPSAKICGAALSSEHQVSTLDPAPDERRDSLSKPIVESKIDVASASNGEATIRLITTPTASTPLVGEEPAATTEKAVEASEQGPMDVDISPTSLTRPDTKSTSPPAFVFGSPTAGVSNTQFGNAAALVLEEMNRRLGVSSGGAKLIKDGGKIEFGVLPGLNTDVSETLEKLRVVKKDESRFARAHGKEFAKMDSITNHYSLRRPLEKTAGKKRKSMEGASHHDTLVPLNDHSAKDGPTAKRQKTGGTPSLSRKASTSSLVAKGTELPQKSQDKGALLKKIQRDRERRSSRVGAVRRSVVSGSAMSKPGVVTRTSGRLGLLRNGAAKLRNMLGSVSMATSSAGPATRKTPPAPSGAKAKEKASTNAPTSTEGHGVMKNKIAEPKGRKFPGPASRPNATVSKASSSNTAAQTPARPTPRKPTVPPTTSQVLSASAAGLELVKSSTSNLEPRGTFDKAGTPTPTETLTVKSPIIAPGTQDLTPPAASGASGTPAKEAVGSVKKTVRATPHSLRPSRLYTPTASSLARLAATNAKYRTGGVPSPGKTGNLSLGIVQEVNAVSPSKTAAGLVISPITPKTPRQPLSRTPANASTAVEADSVSPIPAPPAHLSKTNTLAGSPLNQINRPYIARSKVFAKVMKQGAAAVAAGTPNPWKTPRKSAAVGAGASAKAATMGETPQEHKSAQVQEAFERRVKLSEAAIRRSRIGQMPIV